MRVGRDAERFRHFRTARHATSHNVSGGLRLSPRVSRRIALGVSARTRSRQTGRCSPQVGTAPGPQRLRQPHRAILVEVFNTRAVVMATMNFSIPDEIKDAFNREFSGHNKSAWLPG